MRLRSAIIRLEGKAATRLIGSWLGQLRFRRWKARNPGRPFSDFYVDKVKSNLGKGKGHPTLGRRGFLPATPTAVDWTADSFANRGRRQWEFYSRVTGLSPAQKCVDFGCGSLRIGQHAIRQLDPGNYWGLDVTDEFVRTGLELMDPGLVTAKQPHFSIIDDKALEEVRAWEPKAIFANAVLQHVPPVELPTFFQRLGRILAPGAVAAIVFIADASITQVKAMSWAYPDEVLTSAMLEADRKLRARFFLIDGDDANAFHAGRRLLKIDRLA